MKRTRKGISIQKLARMWGCGDRNIIKHIHAGAEKFQKYVTPILKARDEQEYPITTNQRWFLEWLENPLQNKEALERMRADGTLEEWLENYIPKLGHDKTDKGQIRDECENEIEWFGNDGLAYCIRMKDGKPTLRWDFNSLKLALETIYSFYITADSCPFRIYRDCGKLFGVDLAPVCNAMKTFHDTSLSNACLDEILDKNDNM